jgi:hypothetical protein
VSAPVIFVHIPKTAGTTLTSVLESQYEHVWATEGHQLDRHARLSREAERDGARAFAGHMPHGLHALLKDTYAYVTLLRGPVERIVSHYHAVLRHSDSPLHDELVSNGMGPADYVRRHSGRRWFNNGQARLLGGSWSDPERPADAETLEAAKRNLRSFAVAGLTERFDDSVELMRRRLGWGTVTYRRRNVVRRTLTASDLDRETREAIAAENALDMELYRWAEIRFAERLAEDLVQGPALG